MARHAVVIEERLVREFELEAPDWGAAMEAAMHLWHDAQVVLDEGDFAGASVSVDGSGFFDFADFRPGLSLSEVYAVRLGDGRCESYTDFAPALSAYRSLVGAPCGDGASLSVEYRDADGNRRPELDVRLLGERKGA